MRDDIAYSAFIKAHVLAAFGLQDYDAGLAPVPWRARVWRRVTFAYRRGKAVDWRSYNRAEAEMLAAEAEYRANLPHRIQAVADMINGELPEGLRFEWTEEPEP